MSINNYSHKQLLDLANNTTDEKVFHALSDSTNMFVRRALARNKNTPRDILTRLANDPVQNVSYMASLNANCLIKRDYDKSVLHPCVYCEKDERVMDCNSCSF